MNQVLSFTEENYLKAIYHLSEDEHSFVSTNALADNIKTKPATVSDMIKRLARKELVHYQKYKGVSLTETGSNIALRVIRKHRLWEVFLVEKLNFRWDEVHEVAEQLEHIRSPLLVKRLDEFLGSPKVDPHGDPIPDEEGRFHVGPQVSLSEMAESESGVISGVTDNEPRLLKYLDKVQIRLGLKIKVIEKVEFDGSLQLEIEGLSPLFLSHQVAEHLMIRKL